MNRSIIRYILGSVLKIEAAFMLLTCIVAVCYGEKLMRAESPGPSVGKLVPKVKHTAQILYIIYITLTVVQIIFLLYL